MSGFYFSSHILLRIIDVFNLCFMCTKQKHLRKIHPQMIKKEYEENWDFSIKMGEILKDFFEGGGSNLYYTPLQD